LARVIEWYGEKDNRSKSGELAERATEKLVVVLRMREGL